MLEGIGGRRRRGQQGMRWLDGITNSMKLSHARGATQDRWAMVERSDRMWSTGEGNGKPLQYSCLENLMNSMKREKDRTLK